jgi:hypothetical protein
MILMGAGAVLALIGLIVSPKEFLYAWLVAFMFFLSLGLGALWLVIVHHLFDAGWSVAIRRFCEHISTLLSPWMLFLFLPNYHCSPRSVFTRWPRFALWSGSFYHAACDIGRSNRIRPGPLCRPTV